jgi:hypothetical protein
MEIGVFGSPGSTLFTVGVGAGAVGGILMLFGGMMALGSPKDSEKSFWGGIFLVGLCLAITAFVILPIGHGKERVGDCFDRIPAATLAVDGAFKLNDDILYVVVRGKDDIGNVVRACATLPMNSVKDYPGRPVEPGEYWVVVADHESSGSKWTTNTFVPVAPETKTK